MLSSSNLHSLCTVMKTLGVGCLVSSCLGCNSGPAPLPMPNFDPSGIASRALELYDSDDDGFLSDTELDSAPGLKAALKNFDTNQDNKISGEEVAARVEAWDKMRIGIMSFDAKVLINGKMLDGAEVTFEPEEFLDGVVQSGVGYTMMDGSFSPEIPEEKKSSPTSPPGMQAGIYRVKVSKVVGGKETIPARYNSETILGQEVSFDDPAIANKRVVFEVKSK